MSYVTLSLLMRSLGCWAIAVLCESSIVIDNRAARNPTPSCNWRLLERRQKDKKMDDANISTCVAAICRTRWPMRWPLPFPGEGGWACE